MDLFVVPTIGSNADIAPDLKCFDPRIKSNG
jgi:hypothetical protein